MEGRDYKGKFIKGVSGNPAGRPRRKTFRDYFDETEEEELINRIKEELREGKKTDLTKMAIEQIFGKARQTVGVDGGLDENDKPLPLLGGGSNV